jgi:hypothetical protein
MSKLQTQGKTPYTKPALEKFGSVRNLTGGSLGIQGDGMGTMQSGMGGMGGTGGMGGM